MPMRFVSPVRRRHLDPAVLGDGLVELRDLVALGQVGIEVVLAREDGALAHLAVDGQRGQRGKLDGLRVQHRQRAGQPQAHRADVGVGRRAKVVGATAEGLGGGEQLHVDFESDHGLVLGQDFRRQQQRRAYLNFIAGRVGVEVVNAGLSDVWPVQAVFPERKSSLKCRSKQSL